MHGASLHAGISLACEPCYFRCRTFADPAHCVFLLSLLPFAMVNIGQAVWAPSISHGFLPGKVLAKAGTVQTKALGNEKRATCELEQSQFQLRQMFNSGQRVPVSDMDEMKLLNMVGEHHIHAHQVDGHASWNTFKTTWSTSSEHSQSCRRVRVELTCHSLRRHWSTFGVISGAFVYLRCVSVCVFVVHEGLYL